MSLGTILIIVLILVLLGVVPTWDHSRAWGYGPSGIVGLILITCCDGGDDVANACRQVSKQEVPAMR